MAELFCPKRNNENEYLNYVVANEMEKFFWSEQKVSPSDMRERFEKLPEIVRDEYKFDLLERGMYRGKVSFLKGYEARNN